MTQIHHLSWKSRLLAAILALALILSCLPADLVPHVHAETGVTPESNTTPPGSSSVVFVEAGGDLFAAIESLPTTGGTVVVKGNISLTSSTPYTWTPRTGKILVTGKYNGQDHKPTISSTDSKVYYDCASEIEFDNLTFDWVSGSGSTEFWAGPSLTIGQNCTFLYKGGEIQKDSRGTDGVFAFRMGNMGASCETSNLEIFSGRISYIQAGNNKANNVVDTSTITVHPGVTVTDFIQCGGTQNGRTTNSTVNIDGANVGYVYAGGYGTTVTRHITLNIKNVQLKALYGQRGGTFQGVGTTGSIIGNLNLTLDNVTTEIWDLTGLSVGGQQYLTVKNATDMKVTNSLAGWDSLTLENATLWVDTAYAGPATFDADAHSLLIVDNSTTTVPEGALLEDDAVVTVDGTTSADLATAYAALPAKGGIIKLAQDITFDLDSTTTYYAWPGYFYSGTKTGPVTITSADPSDPAVLTFPNSMSTRKVFSFRQVTKFSNMELRINQGSSGGVQFFAGPSLTFGEGITCTTNNGAPITKNDTFIVRMGDHNPDSYNNIDSKFYMYSGTLNAIQGGNDRTTTKSSYIYVGKGARIIQMIQCGGTSKPVTSAEVVIDGATINEFYLNGHGNAATIGTLNLTIRNATINSVKYHRTTDSGATCTTANITLDNCSIGSFAAKDSRMATGNLTLKNYDYVSMSAGLADWDSLKLRNAVVFVEGSTYAGPETVDGDADSTILVDTTAYQELPTINGVNTAFCVQIHVHSMSSVAAKAPAIFAAGNNAHYHCSGCGKYFADAAGETELDYNTQVYIAPLGAAGLNRHDYTDGKNFSAQTILSSGGSQGAAVYGDLLFKASNRGTCSVIDLTSGQTVGSFNFGSVTSGSGDAWSNHSNSIVFGADKFDENDPFPLLYVCAGNSGDHITDGQYFGNDTVNSYYGHLAIERIFYDESTKTYSSETVQRVFFNDMDNLTVVDGDNLQANLLSTMRDSTTGKILYTSGNGYDAAKGYQKVGWGWPAWFVDSNPTSETAGKLFIFSARYRTYSSYEGTNRNFYKLGSDWNYFLEDGTGNAYIITEVDMPTLPESEDDPNYGKNVILYPKDITNQFSTRYTNGGTQGGTMYQGRLYYSYGFGGAATDAHNRNYINVIDIAKKDIVAEVPLCNNPVTSSQEPECPAIWQGELIISMNPGVYSLGYIALDEPTTKDGKTYIECSLCGHHLKELCNPGTHTLTPVAEEDATCRKPGHLAYWTCSACGENFSDEAGTVTIENLQAWMDVGGGGYIGLKDHDYTGENETCIHCGLPISGLTKVWVDAVNGKADNTGDSAANAVATLAQAYTLLRPGTAGTIYIVGTYTIDTASTVNSTAVLYTFPEHNAKVTICGADSTACISFQTAKKTLVQFVSPTELKNITWKYDHDPSGGNMDIYAGPEIIVGENVTFFCTNHNGIGDNCICIRGGYQKAGNKSANCTHDNTSITVNSGILSYVMGGNGATNVDGNATIKIGGTAKILLRVQSAGANGYDVNGNVNIEISGGEICGTGAQDGVVLIGHGSSSNKVSVGGKVTVNITGGTVSQIITNRTTYEEAGDIEVTISGTASVGSINLNAAYMKDGTTQKLTLASGLGDQALSAGFGNGWDTIDILTGNDVTIDGAYTAGSANVTVGENTTVYLSDKTNTSVPVEGEGYTGLGTGDSKGKFVLLEAPDHLHNGSNFDVTKVMTGSGGQGNAIYGNYIFCCDAKGACNVYDLTTGQLVASFNLGSYNNGVKPEGIAGEGTSGGQWTNHSNQVMFGSVKFDESDPFPLLYVTTGNSGYHDGTGAYIAKCAIERITNEGGVWKSEIVQIIEFNDFDNIPEQEGNPHKNQNDGGELQNMYNPTTGRFDYISGNGYDAAKGYQKVAWGWPAWFVDSDPTSDTEGKIYIKSVRYRTKDVCEAANQAAYGFTGSYFDTIEATGGTINAYIVTEFSMPALPTSKDDPNYGKTVTLYPKDIENQFETEYSVGITQGGTMYQGKIYYSYGWNAAATNLHHRNALQIFDIAQEKIVAKLWLCNDSTLQPMEPECCSIWNGKLVLGLNHDGYQIYVFDYFMLDVDAKAPTCTEAGTVAHAVCSKCEGIYYSQADYKTVLKDITGEPATAHGNKTHYAPNAATPTEPGNIEYWYCAACNKYFKDEACTQEITQADTVIPATGILGDADGDGEADSYDAALILQFCVGIITEDQLNLTVLDVDGDGITDAYDASLILQLCVGIIDKFPAQGN